MGSTVVEQSIAIRAAIADVFDRITDHESMRDWPGVSDCRLIAEGTPHNGLGAIRKITARGLALQEKVVQWEPPHRYDYSIIKGLPVDHRGTVTLSEADGVVTLTWKVRMSSRVPLLAQIVGYLLKGGLGTALDHVRRQIEQSPGATPSGSCES